MPKRRSYAVHPEHSMVGLSANLIDRDDLSAMCAELGLKPLSAEALEKASDDVQSTLLAFLSDFGRERPLPAAEWQAWAKEIEASGRRMLELLQQPKGQLYAPNEERFSILIPGLDSLENPVSRLAHVHRHAFNRQPVNDYAGIARAIWSVEYLIALAQETAAYWKRAQRRGRRKLGSEASLAINLAVAFTLVTGKRATVATKADTGERYGPAILFMCAVAGLAASRLESGLIERPGRSGATITLVALPERQELSEVVARLKTLAGSPNPFADQLRRARKALAARQKAPQEVQWKGKPQSAKGPQRAD